MQDGGAAGFGTTGDAVINNAGDALIDRIASVTITGFAVGTGSPSPDHFGFTAQQIGAFKARGFTPVLTDGTDAPIELSPITGDVTLREV